ncbi:tetratricopeptide repeat protein [Olleya aquimaris]|nr:tetratricopeptide repeat protein [Olleya aquimaris]
MSISEKLKIQVDDYLDGLMSDSELSKFTEELFSNLELQDYVAINKEMRIQYNDEDWQFLEKPSSDEFDDLTSYLNSDDAKLLKNTLTKVSSAYNKDNNAQASKTNKAKVYSFFAIAASIVLIIGLFILNRDTNLYNNYNSWEELPSLIERGDVQSDVLQNAENAFISKDYKTANSLYLKALENPSLNNVNVYLYLGITQLELGKHEEAIATFDKILESDSIDFSKGYWYKALVYLKLDNIVEVKKQLKIILKDKNHYMYEEAIKIYSKLK